MAFIRVTSTTLSSQSARSRSSTFQGVLQREHVAMKVNMRTFRYLRSSFGNRWASVARLFSQQDIEYWIGSPQTPELLLFSVIVLAAFLLIEYRSKASPMPLGFHEEVEYLEQTQLEKLHSLVLLTLQ
jgi:hypothetical protein